MTELTQENLLDFCERVESLCDFVAGALKESADHGTAKERILKLKDEAADYAAGLSSHPMRPAKYVMLDAEGLADALA